MGPTEQLHCVQPFRWSIRLAQYGVIVANWLVDRRIIPPDREIYPFAAGKPNGWLKSTVFIVAKLTICAKLPMLWVLHEGQW